jgi:O-methyltransferase
MYNLSRFIKRFLLKRNIALTRAAPYMNGNGTSYLSGEVGDYVRITSIELVAYEMNAENLVGNVAELGVYQGNFAKVINKCFPNRKLYLFDTFEGFDKRDIRIEKEKAYSSGEQDFSATSVAGVLEKMTHPECVIVKQGYFPETVAGLEEKFVFVDIDVDLYKPTYEGLSYFYPRLVRGGYIFVHDYNNDQYRGVKEAVHRYCLENEVSFFPLCDACGTAVISK